MNRNWIVVGLAVTCAALLATGGLTADEPKKKPKDEIKEMMTKLHKGDKSALARTGAELKKDTLDWEQLTTDSKEFAAMGDMLKKAGFYTDPMRYIDSAAAFGKAVGEKVK